MGENARMLKRYVAREVYKTLPTTIACPPPTRVCYEREPDAPSLAGDVASLPCRNTHRPAPRASRLPRARRLIVGLLPGSVNTGIDARPESTLDIPASFISSPLLIQPGLRPKVRVRVPARNSTFSTSTKPTSSLSIVPDRSLAHEVGVGVHDVPAQPASCPPAIPACDDQPVVGSSASSGGPTCS